MTPEQAARAWVEAWQRGWTAHNPAPIGERYADDALFVSHPFREPLRGGAGAREYARKAFEYEEEVHEIGFGEPIVAGNRAAVEYWSVFVGDGREQTLRGVTLLRFREDGLVIEHRDFWATADGRHV
jgi:ketosteroid isomerase-like protein